MGYSDWIPTDERLPDNLKYVLLSFLNYPVPMVGRYETDDDGGAYYIGDDIVPLVKYNIFVNAWQELPSCLAD